MNIEMQLGEKKRYKKVIKSEICTFSSAKPVETFISYFFEKWSKFLIKISNFLVLVRVYGSHRGRSHKFRVEFSV